MKKYIVSTVNRLLRKELAASPVLYRVGDIPNIIKTNQFSLSVKPRIKNKGKDTLPDYGFYLSTSRLPTSNFFPIGKPILKLDGTKLAQRYKIRPVVYGKSVDTLTYIPESRGTYDEEYEDRIFSKQTTLPNAKKYIIEVMLSYNSLLSDNKIKITETISAYKAARLAGIPVSFYSETGSKANLKKVSVDVWQPKVKELLDKTQVKRNATQGYEVKELYEILLFAKSCANEGKIYIPKKGYGKDTYYLNFDQYQVSMINAMRLRGAKDIIKKLLTLANLYGYEDVFDYIKFLVQTLSEIDYPYDNYIHSKFYNNENYDEYKFYKKEGTKLRARILVMQPYAQKVFVETQTKILAKKGFDMNVILYNTKYVPSKKRIVGISSD